MAAAEDAEHCVCASPTFVKGHLRLAARARRGPGTRRRARKSYCKSAEGLPGSKPLMIAKDALVKDLGASFELAMERDNVKAAQDQIEQTKRAADDANDPRHAMAAGDYGSALAAGGVWCETGHGGGGDVLEKGRRPWRRGVR